MLPLILSASSYFVTAPKREWRIPGGVAGAQQIGKEFANGDVGTCAITINAVKQGIRSRPGLQTMANIPLATYFP